MRTASFAPERFPHTAPWLPSKELPYTGLNGVVERRTRMTRFSPRRPGEPCAAVPRLVVPDER